MVRASRNMLSIIVQICPYNGWRQHPKYVEQFADINKQYIGTSFSTIIDKEFERL